jgi:phospholipid-binding lipoprotein MlaA
MPQLRRYALLLMVVLFPTLAAAQVGFVRSADEFDPLERYNRRVFAFNQTMDRAVIRPVARGYEKITTQGVRTSVTNFFANLRLPLSAAHALLQGKPRVAGRNLTRFSINSTMGVLGLFDPASRRFDIQGQQEDLGQTLAVWGVPEGPFIVLPFIGPSTGRDAIGGAVDGIADPVSYYARQEREFRPLALDLINLRASLFHTERYIDEAYDPYSFVRDAYRQRRWYAIYDGEPPADVLDRILMPEDDPADLLED